MNSLYIADNMKKEERNEEEEVDCLSRIYVRPIIRPIIVDPFVDTAKATKSI